MSCREIGLSLTHEASGMNLKEEIPGCCIRIQEVTIMTNIEKALALISTFATGDSKEAESLLAPAERPSWSL